MDPPRRLRRVGHIFDPGHVEGGHHALPDRRGYPRGRQRCREGHAHRRRRGQADETHVLALVLLVLAGAASLYVAVLHSARARGRKTSMRACSRSLPMSSPTTLPSNIACSQWRKATAHSRWAGAAGIASQQGMLPMSAVTPIYIASITKLHTATIVMLLYEKGMLALDDPIKKLLPAQLIQGINHYQQGLHSRDHHCRLAVPLFRHRGLLRKKRRRTEKVWLTGCRRSRSGQWSVDQTIARADELPPHSTPGTDTFYSDTNFQLLGKHRRGCDRQAAGLRISGSPVPSIGLRHTWLIGHPGADAAIPADVCFAATVTRSRANTAYWGRWRDSSPRHRTCSSSCRR